MTVQTTLSLEQFNDLAEPGAREALTKCCGARAWVDAMLARRPFASFDDVLIASDETFATLEEADWLEAFRAHPKIGDPTAVREKFAATADWAAAEQSGAAVASDDELKALADANRAYQEKFGYIFIVSAAGKSAGQMLDLLVERLEDTADAELPIAATEQMKITHLRLHKLFGAQ